MIDKSHPKYDKIVSLSLEKTNYIIDTKEFDDGEEVSCPLDEGMRVQKKEGCVIIKKLSRLKPF